MLSYRFSSWCFKSKIIPLPPEVVSYIREDGIILAEDATDQDDDDAWQPTATTHTAPARIERFDDTDSDSDTASEGEVPVPPDKRFPGFHETLERTIKELGGSVAPKLNWSAPKDAAWISRFNTMKCTTANDIYLILKSSSFINHDLDHAFDGCVQSSSQIAVHQPVLALRQFIDFRPSLEFRCFVKYRRLVGITQRDLGYYDWLPELKGVIQERIMWFFEEKICFEFPDDCFVFDVYIPEDRGATRNLGNLKLVDINPWSPKTDTLLFGWHELLQVQVPQPILGSVTQGAAEPLAEESSAGETTDDDEDFQPDFRVIETEDQAAYNFSAGQYSAHKLPKEVVDASQAGEGGMRGFMRAWNDATGGRGGTIWQ